MSSEDDASGVFDSFLQRMNAYNLVRRVSSVVGSVRSYDSIEGCENEIRPEILMRRELAVQAPAQILRIPSIQPSSNLPSMQSSRSGSVPAE